MDKCINKRGILMIRNVIWSAESWFTKWYFLPFHFHPLTCWARYLAEHLSRQYQQVRRDKWWAQQPWWQFERTTTKRWSTRDDRQIPYLNLFLASIDAPEDFRRCMRLSLVGPALVNFSFCCVVVILLMWWLHCRRLLISFACILRLCFGPGWL